MNMQIEFSHSEYAAISESVKLARKIIGGELLEKRLNEEEAQAMLSFLTNANSVRKKIKELYEENNNA